ncbi:MAG: formylglycine-generating enzyme family protein [Planctomycetes bacterium]|nr:formylglycine-generating enzyme family protein [Planctomycetota bacterium]
MPVVGLAAPDYPDAQNELNRRGFVNRHTVHSCVGGDGVKRCSGIQRNYGGALSQNAFRITAEDFAGANIVFSALHFCLTDVAVTFTGESSYDAIWQAIPGFETEVMTELTTQLHLQRCRDLAEQGFRPAAISVAEGDAEGRLIAASGWRRPKVALDVKESLVKREANRAAILLRLGSPDLCSQLLKGSPDPRIRARLMCRLPEIVPCSALEQQLERETDVSSRRAIVLALGGYPAQQMPAGDRERLATVLLDWYRNDPDPGIHGACEWLLERWNLRDRLEEETKMLATGQLEGDRQWYVTGSGQSMILLGPVTKRFLTGSPPSEPGHELDQTPRLQFIPRRFAIAAKETTVAEFQAFCGECPQIDGHYTRNLAPQPTCPQISVSWYQAAVYCRWLSEKEGIAEEQMCYPPLDQIKEGMTMPADYLRRTGYRLPTEAEWEYACRANTVTARYFGESTDLMGEFAWSAEHADGRCHPVGSLKPNDFGVFDMLGNVWEWCQNRYDNNWTVHSEDPEDLTPLDDAVQRSRRGGAYSHGALSARAACRDAALPNSRVNTVGFRVARTMP